MDIRDYLKEGEFVRYGVKNEKGRVFRAPAPGIRVLPVVYNCGGDWDRWKAYTAASSNMKDLKIGWIDSKQEFEIRAIQIEVIELRRKMIEEKKWLFGDGDKMNEGVLEVLAAIEEKMDEVEKMFDFIV